MLTLFDYLPSQNGWKVRQLFRHLGIEHRVELISIFQGEGRTPTFLEISPWGAVPAVRFEDGRVLSESNAILWHFARSTDLVPIDEFEQSKVMQWLSFEADYVQTSLGSLRYWLLTGKLGAREPSVVESKRKTAQRALRVLDEQLRARPFIVGDHYSIADLSLFAYASRATEAGFETAALPHFSAWVARIEARPDFLSEMYLYAIDPHASAELP